jgi:mycothiol synthase
MEDLEPGAGEVLRLLDSIAAVSMALPDGFSARPAQLDDCDAIAELVNEVNIAEVGVPWTTADDVRTELTAPGHDPEDHVVLLNDEGSLAGYMVTWRDEPLTTISLIAFVPRDLWGRGLSAWLLRSGEAAARARVDRERPSSPIHLQVARWAENALALPLFESLGYRYVRTFHEMRIELGDRTEDPVVPGGIGIRTFDPDRDAPAVHRALAEAFEDHWGSRFDPFDVWRHENLESSAPGFDPSMWFLALDGDEVVGVACCRERSTSAPDAANVDELGVRRAWRGRGIARALLLTAFAEARRRGVGAVELTVDSESPTGATRLYESVGMRPGRRSFERWEKLLAPTGT